MLGIVISDCPVLIIISNKNFQWLFFATNKELDGEKCLHQKIAVDGCIQSLIISFAGQKPNINKIRPVLCRSLSAAVSLQPGQYGTRTGRAMARGARQPNTRLVSIAPAPQQPNT